MGTYFRKIQKKPIGETSDAAPITLEEWQEYIEKHQRLIPDTRTRSGRNPMTGEEISLPPFRGAVYMLAGEFELDAFCWNDGAICTYEECYDHPIIEEATVEIANEFKAIVVDWDGTELDLNQLAKPRE